MDGQIAVHLAALLSWSWDDLLIHQVFFLKTRKPGHCWEVKTRTRNLANMHKILDRRKQIWQTKPNFGKWLLPFRKPWKRGHQHLSRILTGTVTESPRQHHKPSWPETVYRFRPRWDHNKTTPARSNPWLISTYAVAVPRKIAQEYGLTRFEKVEGHPGRLYLEFNDREQGLQKVYGLHLQSHYEPALRYQAIQSGDIQITDAYFNRCWAGSLWPGVLEDDKQLFPPYCCPHKEALLKKHPELEGALISQLVKITGEPYETFRVDASLLPAAWLLVKEGLINNTLHLRIF